jgi:hypothetical protein
MYANICACNCLYTTYINCELQIIHRPCLKFLSASVLNDRTRRSQRGGPWSKLRDTNWSWVRGAPNWKAGSVRSAGSPMDTMQRRACRWRLIAWGCPILLAKREDDHLAQRIAAPWVELLMKWTTKRGDVWVGRMMKMGMKGWALPWMTASSQRILPLLQGREGDLQGQKTKWITSTRPMLSWVCKKAILVGYTPVLSCICYEKNSSCLWTMSFVYVSTPFCADEPCELFWVWHTWGCCQCSANIIHINIYAMQQNKFSTLCTYKCSNDVGLTMHRRVLQPCI